jgi:thioredoxin 1
MSLKRVSMYTLISLTFGAYAAKDAREIKTMNEYQQVMAQKQPLVIMFYVPWCSACKSMKDPFNEVADQLKNEATLVKINAENDKLKEAIENFGIEAIPTIVIKHVGVLQKEQLKNVIQSCLKKTEQKVPKKNGSQKKSGAPQQAKNGKKAKPQAKKR